MFLLLKQLDNGTVELWGLDRTPNLPRRQATVINKEMALRIWPNVRWL